MDQVLAQFDPLIQTWFRNRFQSVTAPQSEGWPLIRAGHHTLISAPTGSGKTLSAFLICLDRLVRAARIGPPASETHVVYISPLKALSSDIQRNLEAPLVEIAALAAREGIILAPIRTAARTGDTPAADRRRMTSDPPHILVTTPESFYILLTASAPRQNLRNVSTIIVDEIHAMADDKRGAHLALSLERLDVLVGRKVQRIGLSATVKPIEIVADFLAPETKIVNTGHRRDMDIAIEVPRSELEAVAANELWSEVYDRLARLILEHRTTLIFVNTRRMSERITHNLEMRVGKGIVFPHHGSLARPMRHEAETRLREGNLRCVVATASLELGIDIGSVDLVCQIGSPRAIAVALQRIGRAGHWVGALPKGRLFPTTRDELIECAAVVYAIRSGDLEKIEIPENALDILAQQIVAEVASTTDCSEEDLYQTIRKAYPYRELSRAHFNEMVEMLSNGIATSRGRASALLHRDEVNGMLRPRRGARLAAITSGGAIPDNTNYLVIAEPDGKTVGTLDEDFSIESHSGDIFLLGTHSWKILRVENGRVRVEDAHGASPTIPFWLGEAPGRSKELSAHVSDLRERILEDDAEIPGFLLSECSLCPSGAQQSAAYVRAATAELGSLPTQTRIVAERFFDEGGGMQLVLHAPFGSRINRAWGLALRKRFCRTFNFELQAAATDNGLVLSLSDQHSFPLPLVFEFLREATVEGVLSQALLDAPMFGARWRWNASRALAILRFTGGRKTPGYLLRMRAEDLLSSVFPDQVACPENLTGPPVIPDHPLVRETIDNCLHEAMDLNGLRDILRGIESGEIETVAIDTARASSFGHEILNANPYAFLDDAPLEERRTRSVELRGKLGTSPGILDPAAIAQVTAEVWPDPRDADELHDALLTLISLPPVAKWQSFYEQLNVAGRASLVAGCWVATERLDKARDVPAVVAGWMDLSGPVTAGQLGVSLGFAQEDVESALLGLEGQGSILQGVFGWCHRRILARIHRATLTRLRREIEPVTTADFQLFLAQWQHTAPGAQLHGADGLLAVIKQLQGHEAPAAHWETEVLERRVAGYKPELLDELCLSGEVMWGRLSPHPAHSDNRIVRPTRIAPISLFLREDAGWLMVEPENETLSDPAKCVLEALRREGASFFSELVRSANCKPEEVEDGLWELVAGGLVTADGFENLRVLIDPKRKLTRKRQTGGRWAIVRRAKPEPRVELYARQLLKRYGVVFRDLLQNEPNAPMWRELVTVLRQLEARGEIRGGRFVDGYTGEQFALPEAVDLLRAVRRATRISHANESLKPPDPAPAYTPPFGYPPYGPHPTLQPTRSFSP